MKANTTLGVKLDKPTRDRLKQLGTAKDRATHWLIKTAIVEFLEREELAARERLEDEKRWARYEKTGHFIGNKQARAWLDDLARGRRQPRPR